VITNWDSLPLVMHVEHMAALLDVEISTIWKRCQRDRKAIAAGRAALHMRPAPQSYQKPIIWYREKVRAHYEGGRAAVIHPRPGRRKPFEHLSDLRLAKEQLTAVGS